MYNAIPTHFPNAIIISELEDQILDDFKDCDLDPENTLWATSFCSDEVNNVFHQFNDIFAGPGPFILGGISGLPFAGITGMKAFLSHVPTHGAAIIMYGPHIGVSRDGQLGQVNRHHQFGLSTCCGSLVGALSNIKQKEELPTSNPLDYQQARVIQHLYHKRKEIFSDPYPLKKATDVAYDAIHLKLTRILEAIESELSDLKIYLMGGVVINTDWDIENYFEVRNMDFRVYP